MTFAGNLSSAWKLSSLLEFLSTCITGKRHHLKCEGAAFEVADVVWPYTILGANRTKKI